MTSMRNENLFILHVVTGASNTRFSSIEVANLVKASEKRIHFEINCKAVLHETMGIIYDDVGNSPSSF